MSERRYFGCGLPYVPAETLSGKLVVIEGTDGVGRSTQMGLLQRWIELQGFPVVTTGWSRSNLVASSIDAAKSGNMLSHLTYSLLYATDFADRLENVVIPALRAGFVVLADRYIYTAIARSEARGLDRSWLTSLFGIALVPDLVVYLRIDVEHLIPRVIEAGGLNYWESGMDMHLDHDLFESFRKYQTLLVGAFDSMASEYDFVTVNANDTVDAIQARLREKIAPILVR